jgi:hypothetical protein
VLFQQTGGLKQATGEESGLEMSPKFFWAIVKALVAGDVLNALGYRIRPYEVTPATPTARSSSARRSSTRRSRTDEHHAALWKCKPLLEAVKVDRTLPKPKVSIIGEFWAMTTEGDGNYQLQRFLEGEGAEADIQLVTAWLLYTSGRRARHEGPRDLAAPDTAKYGLGDIGAPSASRKKLAGVTGGGEGVRALFQTFAHTMGLYGYHLPDMDEIAKISHEYYNNDLRGGEGHMEVGKLIMNVVALEGAHDAQREAVRLHAERRRLRRRAVGHHREVPRDHLLPGGDERRRARELLLARADVPLQGQAGGARRVRARARDARRDARAGAAFLEANPRFASPLHKAPHAYAGNARRTSSPRSRRTSRSRARSVAPAGIE